VPVLCSLITTKL